MAERKAQNKYIPPDFDPKKHDSVNNYHTSRQMRPRPQNRKMGVPVIRFEMPYNVWCEGCEKHVAMGVRFNATKKRVGMYLSTIIWEFGMKCHLCAGWMVIRTDPKNSEYVCMSGVRKKNEEWEPGAETNQVQFNTEEERAKLAEDAFFKLEHDKEDKIKLSTVVPGIAFIQVNNNYQPNVFVEFERSVLEGSLRSIEKDALEVSHGKKRGKNRERQVPGDTKSQRFGV